MLRHHVAVVAMIICTTTQPASAGIFEDPNRSRACLLDEGGIVLMDEAAHIGDRCDGCSNGHRVCIRAMPGVVVPGGVLAQPSYGGVVIHGHPSTPYGGMAGSIVPEDYQSSPGVVWQPSPVVVIRSE